MSSIWAQLSYHLRRIVRRIGTLRMTGSDVTGRNVTESDVSHVTGNDVSHMSGSLFCACATGSCTLSALVEPFDRKWPDRKYVLRMTGFSPAFFS